MHKSDAYIPSNRPPEKAETRKSASAVHPQVNGIGDRAPLVVSHCFIRATRESGYRNVATAIAELIDNSLQAEATEIKVYVRENGDGRERSITLGVLDNGFGMTSDTLRAALQFGGSSRFGERTGLGRFGMGLPNSSVSQTRRFEVYSWTEQNPTYTCYLDIDEIVSGRLIDVPRPVESDLPVWAQSSAKESGTLVVWSRCDRLAHQRATTIAVRLEESLGRLYRFALWRGVVITVNEIPLTPCDPLFLDDRSTVSGASLFGSPLVYDFRGLDGGSSGVEIRFTELPISQWHSWTARRKREVRIVGRAGVSIVRAGREIDYGWYLMGNKRKENYDDWWRCEIRFMPALDELFGVTHNKQGITPSPELRAALEPDLEGIARDLNSRVRSVFAGLAHSQNKAIEVATASSEFLPVPPLIKQKRVRGRARYQIRTGLLADAAFYSAELIDGDIVLTLNREHPFYVHMYKPLSESDSEFRFQLECLLLAAARADMEAVNDQQRTFLRRLRRSWADGLATFLTQ
jgi:hypothetical protein